MRTIPEQRTQSQAGETTAPEQRQLPLDDGTVPLAMIPALIPLGLRALEEALGCIGVGRLVHEVERLPACQERRRQPGQEGDSQ